MRANACVFFENCGRTPCKAGVLALAVPLCMGSFQTKIKKEPLGTPRAKPTKR